MGRDGYPHKPITSKLQNWTIWSTSSPVPPPNQTMTQCNGLFIATLMSISVPNFDGYSFSNRGASPVLGYNYGSWVMRCNQKGCVTTQTHTHTDLVAKQPINIKITIKNSLINKHAKLILKFHTSAHGQKRNGNHYISSLVTVIYPY